MLEGKNTQNEDKCSRNDYALVDNSRIFCTIKRLFLLLPFKRHHEPMFVFWAVPSDYPGLAKCTGNPCPRTEPVALRIWLLQHASASSVSRIKGIRRDSPLRNTMCPFWKRVRFSAACGAVILSVTQKQGHSLSALSGQRITLYRASRRNAHNKHPGHHTKSMLICQAVVLAKPIRMRDSGDACALLTPL